MRTEHAWKEKIKGMKKEEIIEKFTYELDHQYGKGYYSDITVARAVEVLEEILKEE